MGVARAIAKQRGELHILCIINAPFLGNVELNRGGYKIHFVAIFNTGL